jgi:hypothetical protein
MRVSRFPIRRLSIAAASFAAVFALFLVMLRRPEDRGAAEAERDISAGTLRLKTYGLPAPWFGTYSSLMKTRLGVELQGVAGCDVDEGLRRSVNGYNARMETEIAKRLGTGAHEAIVDEARRRGVEYRTPSAPEHG